MADAALAHPDATQREPALRRELIALAGSFAPADGMHETPIGPLQLIRYSAPGERLPSVYEPGVVVVLQGRKQARLSSSEVLTYDPLHCLVASVTMVPKAQAIEASADAPYLCVRLSVDPRELATLLLDCAAGAPLPGPPVLSRGLQLARCTPELLDAVARLLRLLQTPADAPVLAPLAIREIFYRVLQGELGPRLRALAVADSQAQRVSRAIELVKRRFAEPLSIDEVADAAHMSASTLHLHFKQVTSMSPMQFQKQLRLHRARQLMLADGLDASTAAHRVGYESASQFSREYRRLFGAPPREDIRQTAALSPPAAA